MNRKFIVVKATSCCNKGHEEIGEIGVFIHDEIDGEQEFECPFCGDLETHANRPQIYKSDKDGFGFGDKERIIFLPDESDVINHDMKLDIPLKV